MVFDEIKPNLIGICSRVFSSIGNNTVKTYSKMKNIHSMPIFLSNSCRKFFDGASQLEATLGGAGAIIYLNEHMHFKLKMNCGASTNTKLILSLWMLLFCAKCFVIKEMRILGD